MKAHNNVASGTLDEAKIQTGGKESEIRVQPDGKLITETK